MATEELPEPARLASLEGVLLRVHLISGWGSGGAAAIAVRKMLHQISALHQEFLPELKAFVVRKRHRHGPSCYPPVRRLDLKEIHRYKMNRGCGSSATRPRRSGVLNSDLIDMEMDHEEIEIASLQCTRSRCNCSCSAKCPGRQGGDQRLPQLLRHRRRRAELRHGQRRQSHTTGQRQEFDI